MYIVHVNIDTTSLEAASVCTPATCILNIANIYYIALDQYSFVIMSCHESNML